MRYDSNNIFAKILRGDIPSKKLYEDAFAIALADIAPAAPLHVLVIPKGEYVSFNDFAKDAPAEVVKGFFSAVQKVAALMGAEEDGYRILSNHGADASQSVPHFHVHILGGRALGGLLPSDKQAR